MLRLSQLSVVDSLRELGKFVFHLCNAVVVRGLIPVGTGYLTRFALSFIGVVRGNRCGTLLLAS